MAESCLIKQKLLGAFQRIEHPLGHPSIRMISEFGSKSAIPKSRDAGVDAEK
jgi:hypothetical protein